MCGCEEKTYLRCEDINIRDPFVLCEGGKYYMYGTRAKNFGRETGGFDVYLSEDMAHWSAPVPCFDSAKYGLNHQVNWAPEVHVYREKYYMFATFTREGGYKGTRILRSDSPMGPFVPHSEGYITPDDWECLDGTLYLSKAGKPYVVFCHEHVQIIDGTMCCAPLRDDLTAVDGEIVTLFKASDASDPYGVEGEAHYVTDGPFMYRTKDGELVMLWSTFLKEQYAECLVRFKNGELNMDFEHLPPLVDDDGGHGMVFRDKEGRLWLTYHSPNSSGDEHPCFVEMEDVGDTVRIKE